MTVTGVAALNCQCERVAGEISPAAPHKANRVICYCRDCQAYARFLDRPDVMDAKGGTDIIQIAPRFLRFTKGADNIAAVRMTAGGAYRFYASCCHTPLANMASPTMAALGVVSASLSAPADALAALFGEPLGGIRGEEAMGGPLPGATGISWKIALRSIANVLRWHVTGARWPHPFVSKESGQLLAEVRMLSEEETRAFYQHEPGHIGSR